MALIVEDGTGKADAESYISVADATAYHAARGNASWAAVASDTIHEQLLRKATDYMVQYYRGAWCGWRYKSTQALDWPRYGVELRDVLPYVIVAFDVVPNDIKLACADFALIAVSGDLAPNLERVAIREKVGPIEVEYEPGSPAYTIYRAASMRLAPYMCSMGNTVDLVRA